MNQEETYKFQLAMEALKLVSLIASTETATKELVEAASKTSINLIKKVENMLDKSTTSLSLVK